MRNPYVTAGNNIGIEVEAHHIPKSAAIKSWKRMALNGKIIGDGSVRWHHPLVMGMIYPTDPRKSIPKKLRDLGIYPDNQELGIEIVSPIINVELPGWEIWIQKALEFVSAWDEPQSTTTSIHIHVCASSLPLDVLQNLIRIWRAVESGIYRISCGPAGVHRGALHRDYHFCRPMTKDGPLWTSITKGDGEGYKYGPCFNVESLLSARTMMEFAQLLGRSDLYGSQHYHSPRYMGLGLHSYFRLGTIELRTPNFTPYPNHVVAWVALIRAMIRCSMGKDIPQFLLEDLHPLGDDTLTFAHLLRVLRISDPGIIRALHDLWEMGEFAPAIQGPRQSHLEQQLDMSVIRNELMWKTWKRLPDRVNKPMSLAAPHEEQPPEEQFVSLRAINDVSRDYLKVLPRRRLGGY